MLFFYGATPPPLGGVSVYCIRRIEQLKKNNLPFKHFESKCKFNLVKLIFYSWFYSLKKADYTIEVNVSNPLVFLILMIAGLSKYCAFYDHNGSRRSQENKIKHYIFRKFSRKCKSIMLVNDELRKNYEQCLDDKISINSPFLPPTKFELEIATEEFPFQFKYLMEGGRRNIILTTAWRAISTNEEVDLYGLLDSLDVYELLVPVYTELNFVLMIGELDSSEFSMQIKKRISFLSGFNNFIFITGGVSQLPLLSKVKVLLRLTKTDGDSVSVREAIFCGAKVIATNVGYRPPETILISNIEQELKPILIKELNQ